jgi:ABC-type polysaccharide/polyol phosphate export permease
MLNPLGTMIILSVVFSQLFGSVRAYPVYILCSLTAWNFFAEATNATMHGMVWGGDLIKRIYIPRASFGLAAVGTHLVNLLLSLVPLVIVMFVSGVTIKTTVLFLPVSIFFLACFTLGFGLTLSTVAIYFPDMTEMLRIVLTAWLYLTPIIYPENIFPERYFFILKLNPMYYLIKLYRLPLYDGRLPTWNELWPAPVLGLVMLIAGWLFFTSKSNEFAYRV